MSPTKFKVYQLDGIKTVQQMALTVIYVFAADGEEIDDYNEEADDVFKLEHMTEAQQAIALSLCKLIIQSVEVILAEVPDLDPKKLYQSFPALASMRKYVTPSVLSGLKCWQRAKQEIHDCNLWQEESAKKYEKWVEENIGECEKGELLAKYFYDLVLEAEEQDGDVTKVWDLTKPTGKHTYHSPLPLILSYVTMNLAFAATGYGDTVREIVTADPDPENDKHLRTSIEEMSKLETFQIDDFANYVEMLRLYSGETIVLADK